MSLTSLDDYFLINQEGQERGWWFSKHVRSPEILWGGPGMEVRLEIKEACPALFSSWFTDKSHILFCLLPNRRFDPETKH